MIRRFALWLLREDIRWIEYYKKCVFDDAQKMKRRLRNAINPIDVLVYKREYAHILGKLEGLDDAAKHLK